MIEKKEVQERILKVKNGNNSTEEEFLNLLRVVSPGTNFRTALEGSLKSGKGALIVVENENTNTVMDGGFKINCRFSPQRLIELTKMDGAIILSNNLKKITQANVLLTPSNKTPSQETGTRHKAAERVAKQTSGLVIAISERRHEITLFYKNRRYILQTTDHLLRKSNEQIQLLEKQRDLFDNHLERLNKSELRNYPSLNHAIQVIQKGRMVEKITSDLKKQVIELGNEGTLIRTRLKEIIRGVEKETSLVIKDYTKLNTKKTRTILEALTYDELTDKENILSSLAYESSISNNPIKGWRILTKTCLLDSEIANLIKEKKTLGQAIHSSQKNISKILGEDKAKTFRDEIEKIKLNF